MEALTEKEIEKLIEEKEKELEYLEAKCEVCGLEKEDYYRTIELETEIEELKTELEMYE